MYIFWHSLFFRPQEFDIDTRFCVKFKQHWNLESFTVTEDGL